MAPWNYPVQLALLPAVDALAAGNRIAIKPAEATPRTAGLVAELLAEALGPDIARPPALRVDRARKCEPALAPLS